MKQSPKNVSPMSNEGRNSYVTEQLTNALLSLLREKPLNDISISELCFRAGVGRASFYRNFESRENILKAHIGKLFLDWTGDCDRGKEKALSDLLKAMFSHFERHRDFYSLLNERQLIYLLKDVVIGLCGPKPEYSKAEAYASAYAAYSLYGWIEVWFQRGMKDSAEEISALFKASGL